MHIETKYLREYIEKLDQFLLNQEISKGEYIQIGLLMKIFERLENMKRQQNSGVREN